MRIGLLSIVLNPLGSTHRLEVGDGCLLDLLDTETSQKGK
jgi:hypothetical protein